MLTKLATQRDKGTPFTQKANFSLIYLRIGKRYSQENYETEKYNYIEYAAAC